MHVIDADAHVEEWVRTFDERYFDPALLSRRPQVVTSGSRVYWLVDDRLFPRFAGKGPFILGTPTGFGDVVAQLTETKPEPIDSMELRDPEARLRLMDAEGIAVQVLYPTLFLAHPLTEDPRLESALCRSYNTWMADMCGQRPDRLKWVATLPMLDVAAAAREVRWARARGAVGMMLLGTVGTHPLSDPDLLPVFAAASDVDLPIAVHVGWSCPPLTNMVDSLYEAQMIPFMGPLLMGLVSIMASDILETFPGLRIAFLEAGCGWVPYFWERLHHFYGLAGERQPMVKRPAHSMSEYVARGNLYFGFEVDEALLPQVIDLVGDDYLLYASDIPHNDRVWGSVGLLSARTDIPESAKAKILGENARRFYRL